MSCLEQRTQLTGVIPGRSSPLPPLLLCLHVSLSSVLSLLPLRSNIDLILCLSLGAKARGGCVWLRVCVCVCVFVCASWSRRCCLDGCFILAPVAIATLWDFQRVWTNDPINANQHQQRKRVHVGTIVFYLCSTYYINTTICLKKSWTYFQLTWPQLSESVLHHGGD